MKSTKGESTKKTKAAIKAKGTTKKVARKKRQIIRKKVGDTKKAAILGLTETGESIVKKKKVTKKKVGEAKKAQVATAPKRRSDRNRNSSLNYGELSDGFDSSAEETSLKASNGKGKRTKKKSKGRKDNSNTDGHATSEESWQVYDRGSLDSDDTWNEHYYRLQEFHSQHGHSAVPTHLVSENEPEFADWVSRQKQLFREIRTGYRIASLKEERRWRRLQVLQFPLDYEQWLWERKYNELCKTLNGEKFTDNTILPPLLTEWVKRQKEFAKKGVHGSRINSERRANLEKLGVLTRDDTHSLDPDTGWCR